MQKSIKINNSYIRLILMRVHYKYYTYMFVYGSGKTNYVHTNRNSFYIKAIDGQSAFIVGFLPF